MIRNFTGLGKHIDTLEIRACNLKFVHFCLTNFYISKQVICGTLTHIIIRIGARACMLPVPGVFLTPGIDRQEECRMQLKTTCIRRLRHIHTPPNCRLLKMDSNEIVIWWRLTVFTHLPALQRWPPARSIVYFPSA